MIKYICDFCKKEVKGQLLSNTHWFGNFWFKEEEEIPVTADLSFDGKQLCYKCREEVSAQFHTALKTRKLEGYNAL